MGLIVRFHALNPTLKARDDLRIDSVDDFFNAAVEHIHHPGTMLAPEDAISGVSMHKKCATCGHEEQVAQIRTEALP